MPIITVVARRLLDLPFLLSQASATVAGRRGLLRRLVKPAGFIVWGVITVVLRLTGHHLPTKGRGHAAPAVETLTACIAAVVVVVATAYVILLIRYRD